MLDSLRQQTVLVVDVPFVLVDYHLCPLEQVSIETLKAVAWLKSLGNTVSFVSTRSIEKSFWRTRRAGVNGTVELPMQVMARPKAAILADLRALEAAPSEILVLLDMPLAPYTFDLELARLVASWCAECYPEARLRFAGDFVRFFAARIREESGDRMELLEWPPLDDFTPDFSVRPAWEYGLFQLMRGCPNRCSFCLAHHDPLKLFPIEDVIGYMKDVEERYHPRVFWNWDPNVLAFPDHFERFLDLFIAAGFSAPLNFALGLQPDRLTPTLIDKLARAGVNLLTLPFDSGDLAEQRRIGKPYSILTAVRKLHELKVNGRFERLQSSFIIGYPADNDDTIFRIYHAILELGGVPLPFPLYPFPQTVKDGDSAFSGKCLAELHGQLWPLVPDARVRDYQKRLLFLLIPDLAKAHQHLRVLSPEARAAFSREWKRSKRFIELCLSAGPDTPDELARVEAELETLDAHERLLYISMSPQSSSASVSRRLGERFARAYAEFHPNTIVEELDLLKESPGFLGEGYLDFLFHRRPRAEADPATAVLIDKTDLYLDKLRRADKIVLAVPMYTLSIPAVLKAFFELIASRLYYEMKESLTPKPIACVLARHGRYPRPHEVKVSDPQINVQELSLLAALDFIGLGRHVDFLYAEDLFDESRQAEILARAEAEIDEYVKGF